MSLKFTTKNQVFLRGILGYMEKNWRQEEDKEERLGSPLSSLTSIHKYLS
jgi:hypothetical protein